MGDNTKRFVFSWWTWFGLYMGTGLILVLLLPFPYDLISVFGLCILVNFIRGRSIMKRYGGVGGIKDLLDSLSSSRSADNQRPLRYYCMSCGKNIEKLRPNCGSKMKRVGEDNILWDTKSAI